MKTHVGEKPLVLVFGASGQVGHSLLAELKDVSTVVAADRGGMGEFVVGDLTKPGDLVQLVRRIRPQVIVNAAAYTAVDKAEQDEAVALQINGIAPALLAFEAKQLGALFVHYSTDYVFDGSGSHKRREDDPTNPLNAYGRTKLAGEQAIAAVGGNSVVLRTSWVFSDHGQNFVKTMLRLGAERDSLKVVADQTGAPTSAAFIARNTVTVIKAALSAGDPSRFSGLYHLTCDGETTWHGFASAIFAEARRRGANLRVTEVAPISTAEYPVPAPRPLNSRLDNSKFHAAFATQPVPWQQELRLVIERLIP